MYKTSLTKEQAFQKIKHYCAYQERNHQEVKDKLYSFGLRKNEVELLLTQLIEEDFLNEERYATLFAGGKFRIKQWGKVKIAYELKLKKVGTYNIQKALASIAEEDYIHTLQKQAQLKWQLLNQDNRLIKINKTKSFLLQKGYELQLILSVLEQLQ